MDWNRAVIILAQIIVFVALAGLCALGHNSTIQDSMLIIAGSITGINLYTIAPSLKVKVLKPPPSD